MWRRLYRNGIEARDNFLYYLNRNVWVATVGNADTPLNDAVGVRIAMDLTNDMFLRNNDFFTILGDEMAKRYVDILALLNAQQSPRHHPTDNDTACENKYRTD